MTDSYYLQHPRNQMFYKVLAIWMNFLALGKQTWWGYKPPTYRKIFIINSWTIHISAPSLLISQMLYLYLNYNELTFNTLGVILSIVPVNALVNVIILSSKQGSYIKAMNDFMDKIHLFNLKENNTYIKNKLIQSEKNTRWASYFMGVFLMVDWLAWCVVTGFNNYTNRHLIQNKTMRLETVIYVVLPFDYEYNFTNWLIVHSGNVYMVWAGCAIIIVHNSTNYALVFQLVGHVDILKHKIETQFLEYSNEEETRKKLIEVIKYHSFVLNIFRDIQSAFGLNVSANYSYNLIADSLLLYQLMFGDKRNLMMYGCMFMAYLGGLIVISFVLEEIRRQSDGLSILVYNLNWENMSVANQKMVRLMLLKMQPPLVFTASGGLKAGVRPMISIMKSTFSYYVMLKSSMKP